eukprot:TRINITY_DN203_c0_g1_i9.p1 TRINITY_DN203_c0_g1~~TRINITY_DN203_c0_g1_i9.p1  ORF type:complete len:182 (+),score=18.35 TRINITY_DN203_c0_g1_i9:279-824(+)
MVSEKLRYSSEQWRELSLTWLYLHCFPIACAYPFPLYLVCPNLSMIIRALSPTQRKKIVSTSSGDVTLDVWDTAGQERTGALISSFYKRVSAVVYVFDITSQDSFQHIEGWIRKVDDYRELETPPAFLVGNKFDQEQYRAVSKQAAESFAQQNGMTYLETSAKDSIVSVDGLFTAVGNALK